MAAELGDAAVSGVASKVAELWFDSIKREISYVFKYQSHIDDLKKLVNELEDKKQMVEEPVKAAKLQGDEIYDAVEKWLKKVAELTEKIAKLITGGEDEAKRRCFKGLCPNFFKRYNLSKKAVKAAKEGADLLGRRDFDSVSYRPRLEQTELVLSRGYEQFDSRLKVLQDVMEVLNDSNVDMIGVYGMGGVGKTTLVKQIARKVIEDKSFDVVATAEVTQTPDYKKIQDKIARDLGLEFGQQESMFRRADQLRVRLKKEKRVLIILDNIWTKFEFDVVGIPFRGDENQVRDDGNQVKEDRRPCTIILTSRSQDLLCNDMESQENFPVDGLSNEEAQQLFEKIVGDSAKRFDFQDIAHEIVRRCGGLPVALNTIANALKNKSLSIWKEALDQLRNSNPREISGMNANVYSSIKLSYNFLESNEAKYLFLFCSLHREGDSINVFHLLRYGMGLGLFKNVYTLETARNRVHRLIDSLKASCLLLDGETENEVKMHDIIRAVALSIAEENRMFNIQNVADLKEERINKGSTAISVLYNIQELPERLECPQLKFLLLRAKCSSSLQIPDLLFEGMKQLKVLGLTRFCFPSLPSSLGCLINLQTLCLESCRLQDIAMVGQLKKLEILSFRHSNIEQLPTEIGQLMHLRLLDLANCYSLKVIPANVISKLSQLEDLYIGDSFVNWEKEKGGGNSSLVELKGLLKLTTLDIHIWNAEMIQQDLVSVELERFWISVGDDQSWYDKYQTSRFMKFGGLEKTTLWKNYSMKMMLKRTEDLFLEKLKGLQNVVHELDDEEGFPRLKRLHVQNCHEILHIISSVGQVHYKVFPLLESLSLHDLINLETVCNGQLTEDQSFSNLRIIEVEECERLKHLFSFSMAKNLSRLQKITVSYCRNLEMIVGPDMEKPTTTLGNKEIISEDDHSDVKVIFPNLEELYLQSLISLENLWHNQFQGISNSYWYPNFKKLTLCHCERLKYVFSYSMVNSLVQLEHLDINNCKSMEAVVVDTTSTGLGRDEGKLIEMVFPKLNYLELSNLPKLTRFNSKSSLNDNILTETQPHPFFDEEVGLPNLELASDSFRKLKDLKIHDCKELISIFPPMVVLPSLMTLEVSFCGKLRSLMTLSVAQNMVKLTRLHIAGCKKMEEIIKELGDEVKDDRIVFTQLKYLKLYDLTSLKSFCLGNYTLEFSSLEQVYVEKCQNMKTFSQGVLLTPKLHKVIQKNEWFWEGNLNSTIQKMFKEMVGFHGTTQLILSLYPHLKEMWHSHKPPVNCFNKLAYLVVDGCTDMSSAIPMNLLWRLNNLIVLEVRNCDSIEDVFHLEKLINDEHFGPLLPKLKYLKLINLPKFQRFCNFTGNIIELPSLVILRIENCPNMEAFVSNSTSVHMIANNKPQETTSEENFMIDDMQPFFNEKVAIPRLKELELSTMPKLLCLRKEKLECSKLARFWVSFQNLTTLEVSDSDGLRSLMTLSTAESVVKLTTREMTQQVGEEVKTGIGLVFVHLKYLKLHRLPSVASFCVGNYILEFPSSLQVIFS